MLFRSFCTAAIAAAMVTTAAAQSSSSVRGAAINNQHNRHRVRQHQEQEEEEFTFLIADIQYEDGVAAAAAASRKLQGNSQEKGRGNNPNMPEHTINIEDADGMIYEIEEGSGDTAGITSGTKVTLPSQATINSKRKVNLGGGSLKKKAKKSNNKRDLQEDDSSSTELRRHLAITGTKTVVAVKVIAAGNVGYGFSEAVLSDEVFGTNGDPFNLKKGYEQCSHGQLTINPGGAAKGIVNGVTTITVTTQVTTGTPTDAAMRDAVTEAIKAKFGVSHPTAIADQ
jgi:hypothetical protein